jgi:hypothetical protein
VLGKVYVTDWTGRNAGTVTASIFNKGSKWLQNWAWGDPMEHAKIKAKRERSLQWMRTAARPVRRLQPATALRKPQPRERLQMTKELATQAARAAVERKPGGGRRWLVGSPPDSYGDPGYRVEIHVLEGSQAKGAVVVYECRNWGFAVAFSLTFKKLRKFIWEME